MTITKTCNTCEHNPSDKHCIGCEWDKSKGENSKWELKENPIVIERKVLEQIRVEIKHLLNRPSLTHVVGYDKGFVDGIDKVLQIIDKYKGDKE